MDGFFFGYTITPKTDGTFTIGVYRKPTHTDLYLPWDSYHNLSAKYSVINTLAHRAYTIWATPQLCKRELQHLEEVLRLCKYPKWAIKKIFQQQQEKKGRKKEEETDPYIQIPCQDMPHSNTICTRHVSLKNICAKQGATVHFKGGQTLKNIPVSPKDKDSLANKNSVICSYICGRIDCDKEYIGSQQGHLVKDFKNI